MPYSGSAFCRIVILRNLLCCHVGEMVSQQAFSVSVVVIVAGVDNCDGRFQTIRGGRTLLLK